METNYPDLYVFQQPQPQPQQTQQQTQSVPAAPGFGLYKLYVLPDESVFVDDFQDFAKSVLRLKNSVIKTKRETKQETPKVPSSIIYEEKIEIKHSSRTHSRVSVTRVETIQEPIRVEYSSGVWTILEFLTEWMKLWQHLTPTQVNVDINVHSEKPKKTKSIEKENTETLKSLKKELLTLKSELTTKLSPDERKKKEEEIKRIEALIQEQEKKNQEKEDSDLLFYKLIAGGILLVSIPIVAYISGRDFALIQYILKTKKTQKKCEEILQEVETNQNGKANPHWSMIESSVNNFKKSSGILMKHSAISLGSKVIMIASAVTGILGTRKVENSPMLLGGVLGFTLGLSTFLAEKARYALFERKEVEEHLEASSKTASVIMETKEPFGFQTPSPISPEFGKE